MKALVSIVVSLCLIGLPAVAQQPASPSGSFDEGIEYQRVTPPQPTRTGEQVEVLELFWYACPHCYTFEPMLEQWLQSKPAHAEFVRMPAVFSERWEPLARAYYTAEVLGVVDKIHRPLFDAVIAQKRDLNREPALMAFFAEQGVSNEDFLRAFRSFAVDTKVRQAKLMTDRYGIDGVPAIIVNGKYRTSGTTAGTLENALQVVDFLIAKESTEP
jgi:thiol:disulfide interchange protein DsbA